MRVGWYGEGTVGRVVVRVWWYGAGTVVRVWW